jgi:hypothetical protein
VLASGTPIIGGRKAIMNNCSVVVKDESDEDCRVPMTTEVFDLEEGIDLILGMDWLWPNASGISWVPID